MLVTDTVALSEPRITRDGYMVVDARIARTGIQVYRGSEVGRPAMDSVRVYRPEEAVFDEAALSSFAHRPVTDDHPAEMVSASNWKQHAVGMTGDSIVRDGSYVRIPFTVMDAASIKAVQNGKRELSAGYTADLVFDSGTSPDGEPYDALMTSIRGNHLAIVDRGRAGASCRIGDAWPSLPQQETPPMAEQSRAVLVDGVSYQLSDQGAQLIERLNTQLGDAQRSVTAKDGQIAALTDGHRTALSAKDGEIAALGETHRAAIAAKDGEIAALTARIPDAAALDAAIEARASVVAIAKRALGDSFDTKGKSEIDMRRAVVTKRLGDAQVSGKPDEWIGAAFDTLALADGGVHRSDPLRNVIADGVTQPVTANDADSAHSDYRKRLENGWRNTSAKETV